MVLVSIANNHKVGLAVAEAIQLLGGMKRFVHAQDTVVIKPNLVFAVPPFTGFTTDYPVVQAIIRLCQRCDPAELIIAEGSGGVDTELAFRSCGYPELAKQFGVKLVDLNKSPTLKVAVPGGQCVKTLQVPKILLECDAIINVPKLKLYKQVPGRPDWVSLAVKNILGALPDQGSYSATRPARMTVECSPEFWAPGGKFYNPSYNQWWRPRGEKRRIHKNLSQGLVDVHMVLKPRLNIIDAFTVSNDINMTETKAEPPFNLNTILASQDPLALDFIAAKIGGIDPFDIPYLRNAAERRIGESDYDRIQVCGTPLDQIITIWETAFKS
ncbi:MAG: DUF362 domain-containing protein [Candidatus Thorarchaeota archaeon]